MAKKRTAERLFIEKIAVAGKNLLEQQRGLGIGALISLIRKQLGMSQRTLARRAKIPQSTISRIESQRLMPNVATLEKIVNSMECDLLISAIPRDNLQTICYQQAASKAKEKIQDLVESMS